MSPNTTHYYWQYANRAMMVEWLKLMNKNPVFRFWFS
jgi:hypothetical protein